MNEFYGTNDAVIFVYLSTTLMPVMHGRGLKRLALCSQRDLQRLAVGVAHRASQRRNRMTTCLHSVETARIINADSF